MIKNEIFDFSNWKNIAFPWTVVLLSFFLPIIKYGIQIPIFLFILSWFFYPKGEFKTIWWPLLVFSGFYIFHLIGMLYTTHIELGIADLVEKFSLLLFPFFFAFAQSVNRNFRRMILIAFVLGTLISVILSFSISGFDYAQSGDIREFYMSNFSYLFHPSYVAMFINFAMAIGLTILTTFNFNKVQRIAIWIGILFLALTLVFPTSKMGFIGFIFMVGFFLVKWATQGQFFKTNTGLLLFVCFCFLVFIKYDPISRIRINRVVDYVDGDQKPTKSFQVESNAARIYAWKAATSEIKEHPFGVGTGDINVVLEDHFRKQGLNELADKGLNPHNQYLQSAMALGIPALLWFLFSLIFPFGKIIRTKDWLYAFFICLFALNITVESMLEKQSGIIFFAFFNSFFFFNTMKIAKTEGIDRNVLPKSIKEIA